MINKFNHSNIPPYVKEDYLVNDLKSGLQVIGYRHTILDLFVEDGDFVSESQIVKADEYQSNHELAVDINIKIGNQIIRAYLADNRAINLTQQQSIQQLQKFQVIKAFLEVGNLEDSKALLLATELDDVLTEQRKDKYLAMFP